MKFILLCIAAACRAKVDGELAVLDAGTVHDLPEDTALEIIGAGRARKATSEDRAEAQRQAEARKAAEAEAAKPKRGRPPNPKPGEAPAGDGAADPADGG